MVPFDPSVSLVDAQGRPSETFYIWLLSVLTFSQPITVAKLPTAATKLNGVRNFVTDATATTFNGIVAGGGANNVPVFCDGTDWRIG